jgi:hypothetical protein
MKGSAKGSICFGMFILQATQPAAG